MRVRAQRPLRVAAGGHFAGQRWEAVRCALSVMTARGDRWACASQIVRDCGIDTRRLKGSDQTEIPWALIAVGEKLAPPVLHHCAAP